MNQFQKLSNISHLKKEHKLLAFTEEVDNAEGALRQFCLDPEDARTILKSEKFPLFDLSVLERKEL